MTDWISSISGSVGTLIAIGALIAAIVAAIATVRTNRSQSAQLKRLEESQRREQASKVAVWIQVNEEGKRVVMYHNAGPLPIYNLVVTFSFMGRGKQSRARTLGPTASPQPQKQLATTMDDLIRGVVEADIGSVDKHSGTIAEIREKEREYNKRLHEATKEMLRRSPVSVELEFSDGESKWRRIPSGRLDLIGHIHTLGRAEETSQASELMRETDVKESDR